MIGADTRKAVWELFRRGRDKKQIARMVGINPKSVRRIIEKEGEVPQLPRRDKKTVDEALLRDLYARCNGWVERVHEILIEEHGIQIAYSTLTNLVRQMGLGKQRNERCGHVPDEPGAEMQHDTSPYILEIGGRKTRVVCSGVYFRYSKMRYIKFYLSFTRFKMKCFFYEALRHMGYSASECIIDNTNLAVMHGTGPDAVFYPEMEKLAKRLGGFKWKAHRLRHSNRKAGKERNFWTLETNLFPGRRFRNLDDLNNQAFEWATKRHPRKPQSKTRLIPVELFEHEKPYLNKIPEYVEPPYLIHERRTDEYGFVSLHGNFYWVPGTRREKLKVIEYPDKVALYKNRCCLIEYPLAAEDVKRGQFRPC